MNNNICHFVFGMKKQTEEFLFCYYIAVYSAYLINNPDIIYFYYHSNFLILNTIFETRKLLKSVCLPSELTIQSCILAGLRVVLVSPITFLYIV